MVNSKYDALVQRRHSILSSFKKGEDLYKNNYITLDETRGRTTEVSRIREAIQVEERADSPEVIQTFKHLALINSEPEKEQKISRVVNDSIQKLSKIIESR